MLVLGTVLGGAIGIFLALDERDLLQSYIG